MNSVAAIWNGTNMTAKIRALFAASTMLLFFPAFAGVMTAQSVAVPSIAQPLVPAAISAGAGPFTLRVNGTGFSNTSAVNWNGTALPTTYVSGNELQAAVPGGDVAGIGSGAITVVNPALPNPKISGTVWFPINTPINAVNFTSVSIPTGTNPTGVVLADVNNDGILDMVICNDYNNTIDVFLGTSGGSFQSPIIVPAYGFPYNIFAGDFNNDGILDLATVDKRQNAISIFLGNGNGTFQHFKNYPTQGDPLSMNIGDFNGDGNLDVVTVNSSADTISVFLGKGDGTFQPTINTLAGATPTDVAVGDFNGDGIPDLAVADNSSGYAAVLMGNGDGTFKSRVNYAVGKGPNAIRAADLNKDGILDLITTNATGTVSILLGNGDGTFQAANNLKGSSFPSYAISTYDFNNDGNVDIMVPELNDNELTLFLGNGDGTFQPGVNYPVLMHPDAFAVADFNNDGRLDMAVADETSNMVTLLTQTVSITLNPISLAFGNVKLGQQSGPQTSTVTNISSSPVTISGIVVAGKNANFFSQTNDCPVSPATLNAGQSCTITATFAPLHVGSKSAEVNITDNVGLQALTMTGTGVH